MTQVLGTENSKTSAGAWSLLAGGVACLAASPYLTLRMLLPGILLLSGVLLAIGNSRLSALSWLMFFTRFWLLAIITSVWGTPVFGIAAAILCLGLLLDMPAATRHIAAQGKGLPRIASGVILATGLMGIGLAILALRVPANMPPQWTALMFFMAGAYCTSLIPPLTFDDKTRGGHKSIVAQAGIAALLAANLGGMAQVGAWMWAAEQADARDKAGDFDGAQTWAVRETEQAESLGFEGGTIRGLERQARLAGARNMIEKRLALNEEILRRAPGRNPARVQVVRDALALDKYRKAYEQYWQLPEDSCDANASVVMLVLAGQVEDWPMFLKAARHLPPGVDMASVVTLDTRRAGRGLYFMGERIFARRMLEQACASSATNWNEGRLLFFLLLDEGQPGKALELLNRSATSIGPEERSALERLAKGNEIKERRGVVFDNALQCVECRIEPDPGAVGGQFTMHFKWLALKPLHPGWRVFVHFRQNLYGGHMFQADHAIAAAQGQDAARTGVGEPIEYALGVPIPTNAPAGTYSVFIGLWDGKKNRVAGPAAELPADWRIAGNGRVQTGGVRIAPQTNGPHGGNTQ